MRYQNKEIYDLELFQAKVFKDANVENVINSLHRLLFFSFYMVFL
jgi:hypothetical protein